MEDQIHGHEVLKIIAESGNEYTKESLVEAMNEKFGKDAQYRTCSIRDMSPETMVDFFIARGKFKSSPGGFKFDAENACQH